eukprot:6981695-Ditylum_brightwellii.AAC.1
MPGANGSFAMSSASVDSQSFSSPHWDHEDYPPLRKDIYFVAEVMRLVAARWREASNGKVFSKRTGKRGRPPKNQLGVLSLGQGRDASSTIGSGSDARSSKKRKQ